VERVVIVGAGFAGLRAARALRDTPVDVTIIDRHNYQTFQPLLYQVATAGLNVADVAFPVRGVLRRYRNCRFLSGEVTSVDHSAGLVGLSDGGAVAFDVLIVAAGARAAYFGVPGAEEHSFALYALTDAVRLRNHVLRCFEAADADPQLAAAGALTFVVVGGGPTGVEMAGALVEVIEGVLRKDFPRTDARAARVVLVEMRDVVLPPFGPRSQKHALKALRQRGVEILFGEKVAEVTPTVLRLVSGAEIATRTVIWAAGVQSSSLADVLGAEQTQGGRVVVDADLSLPGHPNVFVVGDMAAAAAPDGSLYPQLAQVAIQAGEHVAQQAIRRLRGRDGEPFIYKDKGIMATIGRRSAVTELPSGIHLAGTIGWLSWLFLHLLYLVGFRNRLSVLLNWAWSYVARERGPRLILEIANDAERRKL